MDGESVPVDKPSRPLRVGLMDTTVIGQPGSMRRYREQLETCLAGHADEVSIQTIYLGAEQERLDRVPSRLRMWWHHQSVWRAARRIDRKRFDVLHLLDGSFGYVVNAVGNQPCVSTVHDIIPRLQMSGRFPSAPPIGRGARWLIQRAIAGMKSSSIIAADSRSTADDLKEFGVNPPHGIRVVPLAIEPDLFAVSDAPSQFTGPRYLFHIGNNGFYKNRAGAVEVFRRLDDSNLKLVMAGPPPDDSIQSLVDHYDLEGRVRFEVYPDQVSLAKLYREASAFVFPSLYEGFGWPPLEAMSVGCPVVASEAGSLPEVVGNADLCFDTADYDGMAKCVDRILNDAGYRQRLVEFGYRNVAEFSLERLANAMCQLYRLAYNAGE